MAEEIKAIAPETKEQMYKRFYKELVVNKTANGIYSKFLSSGDNQETALTKTKQILKNMALSKTNEAVRQEAIKKSSSKREEIKNYYMNEYNKTGILKNKIQEIAKAQPGKTKEEIEKQANEEINKMAEKEADSVMKALNFKNMSKSWSNNVYKNVYKKMKDENFKENTYNKLFNKISQEVKDGKRKGQDTPEETDKNSRAEAERLAGIYSSREAHKRAEAILRPKKPENKEEKYENDADDNRKKLSYSSSDKLLRIKLDSLWKLSRAPQEQKTEQTFNAIKKSIIESLPSLNSKIDEKETQQKIINYKFIIDSNKEGKNILGGRKLDAYQIKKQQDKYASLTSAQEGFSCSNEEKAYLNIFDYIYNLSYKDFLALTETEEAANEFSKKMKSLIVMGKNFAQTPPYIKDQGPDDLSSNDANYQTYQKRRQANLDVLNTTKDYANSVSKDSNSSEEEIENYKLKNMEAMEKNLVYNVLSNDFVGNSESNPKRKDEIISKIDEIINKTKLNKDDINNSDIPDNFKKRINMYMEFDPDKKFNKNLDFDNKTENFLDQILYKKIVKEINSAYHTNISEKKADALKGMSAAYLEKGKDSEEYKNQKSMHNASRLEAAKMARGDFSSVFSKWLVDNDINSMGSSKMKKIIADWINTRKTPDASHKIKVLSDVPKEKGSKDRSTQYGIVQVMSNDPKINGKFFKVDYRAVSKTAPASDRVVRGNNIYAPYFEDAPGYKEFIKNGLLKRFEDDNLNESSPAMAIINNFLRH